jgi:hypothetical protein
MTKETKELALDKVYSIYAVKAFKAEIEDPYWSVSDDIKERCYDSDRRDLKVWSYILGLIEKDNKL